MPPLHLRILLIEDDPDDAELVLSLFEEMNCDVDLVHERLLTLGLRQIESQEFDLVLLDLSLPDSWGMDTLRRVRKSSRNLPVVLMTGATMSEIADEAEREGALACLFKHNLEASKMAAILSRIDAS